MNQRQKFKIQDYLRYFKENASDLLPGSLHVDSGIPGKHITLIGTLGGDETPATVSMIKLHKLLKNNPDLLKSGKITFIMGNEQAFRQNVPYLHEKLNLAFKEVTSGSYEGKRAATIIEFLTTQKPDLVLDFHTSAIGEMRMIKYRKEQMAHIGIMENISDISYYAAFENGAIPGRLVDYATNLGLTAFSIECGNIKSKKSIGITFDHMLRTLEYFEMIEKKVVPKMMQDRVVETVQMFDVREVIKPGYNFRFNAHNVKTGMPIKKGEIYATFDGGYHVAHEDCYLFLPNKNARARDFDAGYLCKIYKFKRDVEKPENKEKESTEEVDDKESDSSK